MIKPGKTKLDVLVIGSNTEQLKSLFHEMGIEPRVLHPMSLLLHGQYELGSLHKATKQYKKVVVVGSKASEALRKLDIEHFRIPSPNDPNKIFSNKNLIRSITNTCSDWLWTT